MSERFERLVTFGVPPVNYNIPETWTEEVRRLYERLKKGDAMALAPLLKHDIEFLTDLQSIRALVVLKYAPDLPDKEARAMLRRIANVIAERPGPGRAKLPWGDRLEAQLKGLTAIIEKYNLLELKSDRQALKRRLQEIKELDSKEQVPQLAFELHEAAYIVGGRVRKPRSWALQALAARYSTEPKDIEKRIAREIHSGRRRR